MIWYWFSCPWGHEQLISEEQAEGAKVIICEACTFCGHVGRGVLGGKVVDKDYMQALKG